ncbi:MAG TPA: cytochrome P450 [Leptospiraceae bacterium]|nr:cytochrome P450 [Leptospiraceae bacterium]
MMKPQTVPPGPRGFQVFTGSMHFARNPLGYMQYVVKKYGDAVLLTAPNGGSFYLFNHPAQIEEILVKKNNYFKKDIFTRRLSEILGRGLLTSDGEHWLRQRRLIQPVFSRERVQSYSGFVLDYAKECAEKWENGSRIEIHHAMMNLTLRIIVRAIFQIEAEHFSERVGAALEAVMQHQAFRLKFPAPAFLTTPRLLSINRRYTRSLGELDQIISEIQKEAMSQNEEAHNSLLEALASAKDESGSMDEKQIRDELMTILLAGHETTANALTWTFILLSQNPACYGRLIQEVAALSSIDFQSLYSLPYAEAVIKESMRMFPPAWSIGREVVEECEIGGFRLTTGTQVGMMQFITHRDSRFFENPDEFQPERWLDGKEKNLPRFAFFPFGGGQRMCVGSNLAMMEAVLCLAQITKRVKLTLDPSSDVRPFASITLRPRGPVHMKVEQL